MPRRKDAGRALVEFAVRIHETFPEHAGPKSVWTIGEIHLEPGAESIIPGRAWLTLQYRDGDEARLDRLNGLVEKLVEEFDSRGPVHVMIEPGGERTVAAVMDENLQGYFEAAAERHAPGKWMSMPSAAGHDAQVIAQAMPGAMLFVPSIGGRQPCLHGGYLGGRYRPGLSGVRRCCCLDPSGTSLKGDLPQHSGPFQDRKRCRLPCDSRVPASKVVQCGPRACMMTIAHARGWV